MRRAVLIYGFSAAVLGAVLGLFRLNVDKISPPTDERVWESLNVSDQKMTVPDTLNFLFESGLIYKSKNTDIDETVDPTTEDARPEFPAIRSYSVIDGIPHIHLVTEDAIGIIASEGDVLESGWVIKSLDAISVVAVYGDEEQTINITNYERVNDDATFEP